jgi:hypothetical protein
MASGLPRGELVAVSFQGSVERRPFLVVRDRARRAVVIAVRGTMSLSDCVADADASPVDVKPWVKRWGLLGRRGAAGLAAGSSFRAHRAMWVGALNIVAELARIGALERSDGHESEAESGVSGTEAADALEGADVTVHPVVSTTTSGRVRVPISINAAVAIPRPSPPECHGSELRHGSEAASSLAEAEAATASHPKSAEPAAHAPEAWRVVVVGHSLGAGVATLVGLALSGRYPGVRVEAFSPPGGLVSPALAEALSGTVTSYVLGKDMIPRLSLASARRLQHQILMELRGARVSKARLLASLWGAGCAGGLQHGANTCCGSQCCSSTAGTTTSFGCPRWVCCACCTVDAAVHLAPLTDPAHATHLYGLHHLQSERSMPLGESASPASPTTAAPTAAKDGPAPPNTTPSAAPHMERQASALSQTAIAEALASSAGFARAIDRVLDEEDTTSLGGLASEAEAATSAAEPLLRSVRLIGSTPGTALPRMRMAGTVVHLDRLRGEEQRQQRRARLESGVSDIVIRRGCSSTSPKPYTASNRSRDSFRDLVVSTLMVRDHMPDKIMRVLDRVAEHGAYGE